MTAPRSRLPFALRLFLALTLLGSLATWTVFVAAHLRHWPYPWNTPLAPPGTRFYDFFDYVDRFRYLHSPQFFLHPGYPFTYFAPGIVLYHLLYLPGTLPGLHLYLALSLAGTAAFAVAFARALARQGLSVAASLGFVTAALLTSYPLLFCLERGNPEILLALGIGLGLWAFCTGRMVLAALLWALFGAVKLYPLLFLALFFVRRRYALVALALATTLLANLASLWYAGPSLAFAFHGVRRGTHAFISMYSLTREASAWDHSLFSPLKLLLYPLGVGHHLLLAAYLLSAGGLLLFVILTRLRHLPPVNQILVCSVAMVAVPPTSFDYTLVELYGAWAVLVLAVLRAARLRQTLPAHALALALLALLFIPGNLVTVAGLNLNGQWKALLLLLLGLLALRSSLAPQSTPA